MSQAALRLTMPNSGTKLVVAAGLIIPVHLTVTKTASNTVEVAVFIIEAAPPLTASFVINITPAASPVDTSIIVVVVIVVGSVPVFFVPSVFFYNETVNVKIVIISSSLKISLKLQNRASSQ